MHYDLIIIQQTIMRKPLLANNWLPRMDSNHDKQIQNLQCYRYTTRQSIRCSAKSLNPRDRIPGKTRRVNVTASPA